MKIKVRDKGKGPAFVSVSQSALPTTTIVAPRQESGRPLTFFVAIATIVCGIVWLATLWMLRNPVTAKTGQLVIDTWTPAVTEEAQCDTVPSEYRFDCDPSPNATEGECRSRGCCWKPASSHLEEPLSVPYCYYPAGRVSYSLHNVTRTKVGATAYYSLVKQSGYPDDIKLVRMDVVVQTQNILQIKIYDPVSERFEVPFYKTNEVQLDIGGDLAYKLKLSTTTFGFQVLRSTGQIIFNTLEVGNFVFADQLLQLSTLLPSHFIYGLGEHTGPFLRSTQWTQYTMWNFDTAPGSGTSNLYGSHPFYLVMEESGQSHGVFLKNSNAMEVILLPTPALTFRTIGGILDLYFFLGPSPDLVVEQFSEVIGRPSLPPYWSLGYHQCKFGYGNLSRTQEVLERTVAAKIPIDVQWNDLDYMQSRNDFTVDGETFPGLDQFVDKLHERGMHYVPIVDPGVSGAEPRGTYPPFDRGIDMNVFIQNSSGQPFVGRVWNPESTVWPDFTNANATQYWTEMLHSFHEKVPYDGIWIDMNEPSNFESGQKSLGCPATSSLDHPPYTPRFAGGDGGKPLYFRTICPSALQAAGRHYDLHNLYGWTETMATNAALRAVRPNKRPFIISRSTFPGQGHYGGHWTGDIHSDWQAMRHSIAGVLNFNLFGIPMVGADICGFNGNTTAKLCQRWMELGAFYPFSRNHNTLEAFDQDPVSLGPEVVAASKKALEIRYSLLPYLYTLFVRSHLRGTPVARALFFEFPNDKNTYNLGERQFLWGSGLMIAPVLEEDKTDLDCYFPAGLWYDLHNHLRIQSPPEGQFYAWNAPLDTIPLFVRGGTVLVRKPSAQTTVQSRQLPFMISVYLDTDFRSSGELYWDDGDSLDTYAEKVAGFNHIEFACSKGRLESQVRHVGFRAKEKEMTLGYVGIFGVKANCSSVLLNGQPVTFYYVEKDQYLGIPNLRWDLTKPLDLVFK